MTTTKREPRVVLVIDGHPSTPVVNDKDEFYQSTKAAGKVYKVHPTNIALAVRKGGKTLSAGHAWRRATADECKANGFKLSEIKVDNPKKATAVRLRSPKSQTKNQPKKLAETKNTGYRVFKVEANHVLLRFGNRSGGGKIPVVSDRGEFFRSGRAASASMKLSPAAVSSSMTGKAGRETAGGRVWRYATVADCKAHGIDITGFETDLIEIPYQESGEPRLGRPPGKAAKKAPKTVPGGSGATFYGVRWPDGAVTLRANHGSTWTMTRLKEEDLPPELLTEAVWVGPKV